MGEYGGVWKRLALGINKMPIPLVVDPNMNYS